MSGQGTARARDYTKPDEELVTDVLRQMDVACRAIEIRLPASETATGAQCALSDGRLVIRALWQRCDADETRMRALIAALRAMQTRPGCWCTNGTPHTPHCQGLRASLANFAIGWIVTVAIETFCYASAEDGSQIGIAPHVFTSKEAAEQCAAALRGLDAEVVPWNAV